MPVLSRSQGCLLIALAVSLTCLVTPRVALGQSAIGFTAGTEYGFGALGRVGSSRVMIEAGAGILPLLVFGEYTEIGLFGSRSDTIFKIYTPGEYGGRLVLTVREGESPLRFKGGLSHNTMLGTGGGGGVEFQVSSNPTLVVSAGVMIFPDAADRIQERLVEDGEIHEAADFSAPLTAFRMALSISILFGKG